MIFNLRTIIITAVMLGLAVLPILASVTGASYYLDVTIRIMIFAIAAVSLDLVLGYGNLISFGHAAYLGVGAYAVGILSHHGIDNGFIHLAAAIGASALVSLVIGLISLRTAGLHFLMITLGFGQMIYFLGTSLNTYGGEDGMNISTTSDFSGLLDLGNPVILYYFVFACLVGCLFFLSRLVDSRFGMVLRGAKLNERRISAIGVAVFRYRLVAFVISGTICGIAGFLLANQNLFVSPAIMHWTRSSELMIIVILGGMGTLFGSLFGAAALLLLEAGLSRFTEHWQLPLGVVLLLVVLYAKRGIFGALPPAGARNDGVKRGIFGALLPLSGGRHG
jgi:branched-chain amino acid transport system permease protein